MSNVNAEHKKINEHVKQMNALRDKYVNNKSFFKGVLFLFKLGTIDDEVVKKSYNKELFSFISKILISTMLFLFCLFLNYKFLSKGYQTGLSSEFILIAIVATYTYVIFTYQKKTSELLEDLHHYLREKRHSLK